MDKDSGLLDELLKSNEEEKVYWLKEEDFREAGIKNVITIDSTPVTMIGFGQAILKTYSYKSYGDFKNSREVKDTIAMNGAVILSKNTVFSKELQNHTKEESNSFKVRLYSNDANTGNKIPKSFDIDAVEKDVINTDDFINGVVRPEDIQGNSCPSVDTNRGVSFIEEDKRLEEDTKSILYTIEKIMNKDKPIPGDSHHWINR
jgi:hypothetical protein